LSRMFGLFPVPVGNAMISASKAIPSSCLLFPLNSERIYAHHNEYKIYNLFMFLLVSSDIYQC
jgi:hypothetical protein